MQYQAIVFTTLNTVTKLFLLNEWFHSSHQKGATFGARGHTRNSEVSYQQLYGSCQHKETKYGYHNCSLSETAIFQVKNYSKGH